MISRRFRALGMVVSLAACTSSLTAPRTGPHADETPAVVPYPPPPGEVEVIPPRPPGLKNPVWIDGEQQWNGRRWAWKEGGWRDQAPDEYFAPPTTERASDGSLLHYAGVWKKIGASPRPPAASSSASTDLPPPALRSAEPGSAPNPGETAR
jgi:hypothetical protein